MRLPDEASEATDRLRESMIEGRAFVPALWPVEVGNMFLTATRRGRIAADEWPRICASLEALPIEIDPVSTTAHGAPRLDSHVSIGSPATMRRTSNWRCECSYPWPTLDQALGAAARAEGLDVLASA